MISPKDKDQNQDIHPLKIQYVEIKGDAKDEIKDDVKEIAGSISYWIHANLHETSPKIRV